MMKSMIIALALFAAAAVVAAAEDDQPICFRGNDQCTELKEGAKRYFETVREKARAIPALKLTRPGSAGAGAAEGPAKLLHFLDGFQRLFNATAESDCKVETCICNAGTLQCSLAFDKVKEAVSKATPPQCVENSELAKANFEKFRGAIQSGNRTAIAENIQTFRDNVEKEIQERDVTALTCIRETVQAIRKDVKEKLSKYDIKENCDFCKA